MYYTGFADEAAVELSGQLEATSCLGWCHIEARNIGGVNIHDLPEAEFENVCEQLEAAGICVNCFGSTIANWAKQVDAPFESSLAEARRAIPRMQRLGTKLIRIMSFAVLPERGPEDQMAELRFQRLRTLQQMFADAGLTAVHENCMNYGGMGWPYTLRLLEEVPDLKLVFDTGNPVGAADRTRPAPHPRQSAWDFYNAVKDAVAYVHIKDGIWDPDTGKAAYTYPGAGQGDVRRIVTDLIRSGYDGGFSMEPHMAAVFHDESVQSEAQAMFDIYVEYGRRFMKLVEEAGTESGA